MKRNKRIRLITTTTTTNEKRKIKHPKKDLEAVNNNTTHYSIELNNLLTLKLLNSLKSYN